MAGDGVCGAIVGAGDCTGLSVDAAGEGADVGDVVRPTGGVGAAVHAPGVPVCKVTPAATAKLVGGWPAAPVHAKRNAFAATS